MARQQTNWATYDQAIVMMREAGMDYDNQSQGLADRRHQRHFYQTYRIPTNPQHVYPDFIARGGWARWFNTRRWRTEPANNSANVMNALSAVLCGGHDDLYLELSQSQVDRRLEIARGEF